MMPRRQPTPDAEALEGFLAGDAPSDVAARVEAWAGQTPSGRSLAGCVRAAIFTAGRSAGLPEPEEYRRILRLRLQLPLERSHEPLILASPPARAVATHPGTSPRTTRRPAPRVWTPPRVRSVFWGLGLCVMVGTWIGIHRDQGSERSSPSQRYTTQPGQRATITLANRAVVTLAPATTLQVTAQGVMLDGEAFFQIAARAATPFSVRTHGVTTHVLGTAFNVRAYASDSVVRVVVQEGRVLCKRTVPNDAASVVAVSGDAVEWSPRTWRVAHDADVLRATGWMRGQLVFDDTPLTDVLATVRRTYGLDVTLADSALGRRRLTAVLNPGTPTEILAYIAVPLKLRAEWQGHRVILVAQ